MGILQTRRMRPGEGWTVQTRVGVGRWREKVQEEGGVEREGVKLGYALPPPKFSNLLTHSSPFPREK